MILRYTGITPIKINAPQKMDWMWEDTGSDDPDQANINFAVWSDYGTDANSLSTESDFRNASVQAISNPAVTWKVVAQNAAVGSNAPSFYWQIFPAEQVTIDANFALRITINSLCVNNVEGLANLYVQTKMIPSQSQQMSVTVNKKPMAAERQIAITSYNESKKGDLLFQIRQENGKTVQVDLKGLSTEDMPPEMYIKEIGSGQEHAVQFPIKWFKIEKGEQNAFVFDWKAELPQKGCQYFLNGQAVELNEKVTIEVPPDQSVFSASLTLEDNGHKPLPFAWEIAEFCLPHGEISAAIKADDGFMDIRHLEQDGQIIFFPPYAGPGPSPTPPSPKVIKTVVVKWKTNYAKTIEISSVHINNQAEGEVEIELEVPATLEMKLSMGNGFSRTYSCSVEERK